MGLANFKGCSISLKIIIKHLYVEMFSLYTKESLTQKLAARKGCSISLIVDGVKFDTKTCSPEDEPASSQQ